MDKLFINKPKVSNMSNKDKQQEPTIKEPDSTNWHQKLAAAPGLPVEYWNLTEEELIVKLNQRPAGVKDEMTDH